MTSAITGLRHRCLKSTPTTGTDPSALRDDPGALASGICHTGSLTLAFSRRPPELLTPSLTSSLPLKNP